jgi:hypothetical protein
MLRRAIQLVRECADLLDDFDEALDHAAAEMNRPTAAERRGRVEAAVRATKAGA